MNTQSDISKPPKSIYDMLRLSIVLVYVLNNDPKY